MPLKRKPRKPGPEARSTRNGADSMLKVSDTTIHNMTAVFKLLADRSRLKIVLALAQEGKMHVTALCRLLGQSQPAVSHHLTLMRIVGLVGFDRNGKHNYYYLASDRLCELFEQFFADAGDSTQALQFEEFALTFAKRAEA
jgi:ArsR family transcriptional regulator